MNRRLNSDTAQAKLEQAGRAHESGATIDEKKSNPSPDSEYQYADQCRAKIPLGTN